MSGCNVLITAPPANGKTCLMSQLVMLSLSANPVDADAPPVPIVIKISEMSAKLKARPQRNGRASRDGEGAS